MRDTPCGSQIFPLIITQTNCFQHSPSLQERGAGGGELFFYMQKGRRKIIFYIFPFGLYSFLPLLSTPPPYEEGSWERDLIVLLTNVDWTDAVHIILRREDIISTRITYCSKHHSSISCKLESERFSLCSIEAICCPIISHSSCIIQIGRT